MQKYLLLIVMIAFTFSIKAQIKYTGNGIYTSVKTGATGFAKYNTLAKKAKVEIDRWIGSNPLYYEIVSEIKSRISIGTGVNRATITFKLFHKNGMLAITKEENVEKRNAIISEIKNSKELFDLGIMSKQDFDKKINNLKDLLEKYPSNLDGY